MFESIFSFFGGLASKVRQQVIEKTIQPIIDYNLENIFEQKIAIKDLNKGITNVKLNTKYLNGMMKTNTLKEFQIKFIKLQKLQLQMSDVDLILDLNTQIQQEEALESLEVENIMNQSLQIQIDQLKNEFLNKENDSNEQDEQKCPVQKNEPEKKSSSKIVMILRVIDSLFGNIKIDIQNLRIKFIGKIKQDVETSLSLQINNIDCTMQKPQNTNQILFLAMIDQIKLYLNDNKQIGQMNNAIKFDAYLTQNQEPKIRIQAEQLQLIVSLNQINQIASLFSQSAQVLEQRENIINQVLKLNTNNEQFRNPNNQQQEELRKTINLNKYKLVEYFNKSYNYQKNKPQKDIDESTILVQNIPDTKIKDIRSSVKQMSEQLEFFTSSFYGLTIYITSVETDQEFNYQQKNFKFDLENYYSISLCDIRIIKHNKFNIFINSVLMYELQRLESQFQSIDSSLSIKQNLYIIDDMKFLCKIIMKTGKDQYSNYDLNNNGYEILIQEPTIFYSQIQYSNSIKIEIIDQLINMDIAVFNLVLNQNQLQFIMQIIDNVNQTLHKSNNQNKSQTKFQLSQTQFSIYYHINDTESKISSSFNYEQDDYIQLHFFDFFITTPEDDQQQSSSEYQYKSQFKFGCKSISGYNNQIVINNLNGQFGSLLKPSTQTLKKFDEQNKAQITQYLKECKQRQQLHFELQIESVNIKHDSFDNFYQMIFQITQVFNGKQKQMQNNQNKQQNIYFSTKIKKIDVTLYQTLILYIKQFKYYFTIDYHFILLEDLNVSNKIDSQILLKNQNQDRWIFNFIMKQNLINLEFSALKLNLINFNFDILITCMKRFINSIQLLNPPNQEQNEKSKISTLFKSIMIDILPFYNEEIILSKKGQAKLKYSKEQFSSWTRSILIINNTFILNDLIQIEEIQHYFTNNNTANRNDELINLNQFQKVAQIQKIEFLNRNKFLKINSIQFFHISKQIIIDLIDHYEHISKDFKKEQINEKKNYQKLDKIEMKAIMFQIQCDQLSLTSDSQIFELNIHYIQFKLGDKCCQVKLGRAFLLDKHQQSKFKYIFDEEDLIEFEDTQSQIIKETSFLDMIMQFDQNSFALKLQLKPLRICLSGYQFQGLLKSFQQVNKEIITKFDNNNEEDDDESFEIIKQTEPFNLQVELFPIQIIVSFDSEGLDVEGLKSQVLKFGSFNNLILATNQILEFYQNNKTSKQDFIQFLISQQLSTYRILFQAYSTLDITKAASSFTEGIINMFSKPFISNNGFLYGLIEGSYDFTCGVTSSLLQLTVLPANALNNVANYMGLGAITIPISQIEEFCKKLYYKINPEKGIPSRFFKDKY